MMAAEYLLLMLLAIHTKHMIMLAEVNCGFVDSDNALYAINFYSHYLQNSSAYFDRMDAIAHCEITKERYGCLINGSCT